MTRAFAIAVRLVVFIGVVDDVAWAQGDSVSARSRVEDDGREVAAWEPFRRGRELMDRGAYEAAAAEFEESLRLDPGAGTMLNLAYCYEKLGKRAQAWTEYQSAAVAARGDGKSEWESAARARAAKLEAAIAWIVVRVDKTVDATLLDIRLDGEPLGAHQIDRPTPVDLGRHDVKVSAWGKQTWSTTLEVEAQRTPTIEIPALDPLPTAAVAPLSRPTRASAPAPPTGTSSARGLGTRRTAAVTMGAVAMGALGVAAGFALSARSTYDSADCQGRFCTRQGLNVQSRAYGQAGVASVAAATGAISFACAAFLWLARALPSPARDLRVEPSAGPTAWGLTVEKTW
jgi:tetratricopeptide (TPR) repeat protein